MRTGVRHKGAEDRIDRLHAAAFSRAAYDSSHEGRRNVADRLGYMYDQSRSNNDMQVYVNRATGRPIVAIRGTRPSNFEDIKADMGVLVGRHDHKRFGEAVRLAKDVHGAYRQAPVITGHSLGGTIADHVAQTQGYNATIFNPGRSPFDFSGPSATTSEYSNTGDIISNFSPGSVPQDLGDILQLANAHSINQFASS